MGVLGKYGDVIITAGVYKGIKALYFTDCKVGAILNPLTNLDFEIILSYRDFEYLGR